MSEEPIYKVWRTMKQRCDKPTFRQFKDYGGRGIKVCDRWRVFENFLKDLGPPPPGDYSLERLDNDLGYEPGNVIWASRITQARNKRNNVRFEFDGVSMTLGEWAERLRVNKRTLVSRVYLYKWPLERAFTEGVKGGDSLMAKKGKGKGGGKKC